jgi:hypothetical protein
MCTRWITKGKWPKLKEINMGILKKNSEYNGLKADQFIDIILSDFQVLKYFIINNSKGRKLDKALRNKFVKYDMFR